MPRDSLDLTLDETLVLLALCLSSPYEYDRSAEEAIRKLVSCARAKLQSSKQGVATEGQLADAVNMARAEHLA